MSRVTVSLTIDCLSDKKQPMTEEGEIELCILLEKAMHEEIMHPDRDLGVYVTGHRVGSGQEL